MSRKSCLGVNVVIENIHLLIQNVHLHCMCTGVHAGNESKHLHEIHSQSVHALHVHVFQIQVKTIFQRCINAQWILKLSTAVITVYVQYW